MIIITLVTVSVTILGTDEGKSFSCSLKKRQPDVNFINIICTKFSYEHHFSSYFLALLKNLYEKRARIMLMKLKVGVYNWVTKKRSNLFQSLWLED